MAFSSLPLEEHGFIPKIDHSVSRLCDLHDDAVLPVCPPRPLERTFNNANFGVFAFAFLDFLSTWIVNYFFHFVLSAALAALRLCLGVV